MRDFGPNLFAGTAKYYAKYRAKYPAKFFADVVDYFDLDGQGQMLDLGCGTGELAIPLAEHFEKVLALDPEPEMLAEARRKSPPANIVWKIGSSRDLTEIKGPFKLVGLGQSFHWMDTETVLSQLYNLLEPGGGIYLIGSGSHEPPAQNQITAAKDEAVKGLITKYLGARRRAGRGFYAPGVENWESDLFANSKFGGFEKRIYVTKVVRNIDQELGNLYSMSWARRDYFGNDLEEFEREFKRTLDKISDAKSFTNIVKFEAYFLVKK